jgi:NAD(P)-dependent dehydrogenase (short-subunit alcohol dehydrogenase family)
VERFAGKVAVVTGAAAGIGRATAVRLVEEGATVIAVDLRADDLADLAKAHPDTVDVVAGDVSDPATAAAAVAAAVDGHGRLDVLANVAGILRTANSHEVDAAEWDLVLRVNLTGTYLFCQAAIAVMLDAGGGSIVNIGSTAALSGHPWAAAYSASKGGVLALSRTLAVEYAKRGIRVNVVCPGSITTAITDDFQFPEGADTKLVQRIMALDKPRGPETVAAAVAFLASDDAAHVNGESLRVDGGTLA